MKLSVCDRLDTLILLRAKTSPEFWKVQYKPQSKCTVMIQIHQLYKAYFVDLSWWFMIMMIANLFWCLFALTINCDQSTATLWLIIDFFLNICFINIPAQPYLTLHLKHFLPPKEMTDDWKTHFLISSSTICTPSIWGFWNLLVALPKSQST